MKKNAESKIKDKKDKNSSLTDSLTGILKGNDDADVVREEAIRKKYLTENDKMILLKNALEEHDS